MSSEPLRPAITVAIVLLLSSTARADDLAKYVDPFIGTGGHGHTFPGAVVPFGMVQLSPDTRIDGSWDGCSGYHYSDKVIYGFSHTHLSGTGCSDWGDVMLMPYMGETLKWKPEEYGSRFSHKKEKASPGYYAVTLLDEDIDVELTVTPRVGFHRYTFHRSGRANVILDLNHRDKLLDGMIQVVSPTRVTGMRRSEAWARDQYVTFCIEFSKPMIARTFLPETTKEALRGTSVKCNLAFDVKKGEQLLVKVALSPVNWPEEALPEIGDWSFERVREDARQQWERELSKIEVAGGSAVQRRIFYTALYHCMIHPTLAMDREGRYWGMDNGVHRADGFTYYTVFSLWDTFRALHPLLAIIDPARTRDFVQTMLAQYREGGSLPVWELSSNETHTMIGYHAVPVILNAIVSGVPGIDKQAAFEAMKMSGLGEAPGLDAFRRKGVIGIEDDAESVSKTLEYAYDDACIALLANDVGHGYDARTFFDRACNWRNVFDPSTGFMRPRANGGWLSPFDPREVNNHYTEANAWQYTFFVPHDVVELVDAMGGVGAFELKLDELFTAENRTTGRTQADITGMIGQYAHGNEPSHHIAYLYNAVTKPWKTADRVRQILTTLYGSGPDGLCGNEDCGQMSAWFVFSAMGFYPVDPGWPTFQIGWPMFDEVRMHLDDGKMFTVRVSRSSDADRYIQRVRLDGRDPNASYIDVAAIRQGGTLQIDMGPKPLEWFGMHITQGRFGRPCPLPTVRDNRLTFHDSLVVDFEPIDRAVVHFTRDGSTPTAASPRFEKPFAITQTTTIKAVAIAADGDSSHVTTARFHKIPNDWSIQIHAAYNRQYTAGGDDGIIDGLRGDANWRKGRWQGYQGQDFDAVVDLRREEDVRELGAGFLQDTRSWILMPKRVVFSVSTDGKTFRDVLTVENPIADADMNVQTRDFAGAIDPARARYVRVHAVNYGALPSWHPGAGGEAFIFVDEIMVR